MYLKVALFFTLALLLSGCNGFFSPKPKQPNENNKTLVIEQNVTFTPIEDNNITDEPKPKTDKYDLKPEPFSLKSNEEDPELLGPQTTLDRDLLKKDKDDNEEDKEKTPLNKEQKDTKATTSEIIKKDNLQEEAKS